MRNILKAQVPEKSDDQNTYPCQETEQEILYAQYIAFPH